MKNSTNWLVISMYSQVHELKTANKATANMYIVNPFKGEKKKKQSNIWSTHPSTEDRIEAIRNLK